METATTRIPAASSRFGDHLAIAMLCFPVFAIVVLGLLATIAPNLLPHAETVRPYELPAVVSIPTTQHDATFNLPVLRTKHAPRFKE